MKKDIDDKYKELKTLIFELFIDHCDFITNLGSPDDEDQMLIGDLHDKLEQRLDLYHKNILSDLLKVKKLLPITVECDLIGRDYTEAERATYRREKQYELRCLMFSLRPT